jgi:hypothetical protein
LSKANLNAENNKLKDKKLYSLQSWRFTPDYDIYLFLTRHGKHWPGSLFALLVETEISSILDLESVNLESGDSQWLFPVLIFKQIFYTEMLVQLAEITFQSSLTLPQTLNH